MKANWTNCLSDSLAASQQEPKTWRLKGSLAAVSVSEAVSPPPPSSSAELLQEWPPEANVDRSRQPWRSLLSALACLTSFASAFHQCLPQGSLADARAARGMSVYWLTRDRRSGCRSECTEVSPLWPVLFVLIFWIVE